jgi:hypothetical protein
MFKRSRFFIWSTLAALGLVALASGCMGGSVQYDPVSGKPAIVFPIGVSTPTPKPSISLTFPTVEPVKYTATAVEATNQLQLMYATQTAIPIRQTQDALENQATKVSMSVDATMQAVGVQSTQVEATRAAEAVINQQREATQTAINEQEAQQAQKDWDVFKEMAARVFIVGGLVLTAILALFLITMVTVDVRVREREAQAALLSAQAQADEQQARLLAMHDRLAASITEARPADLPRQNGNGNGNGQGKTNGNHNGYGQNGAPIAGKDYGTNKNDDSLRKPQQGRGSGNGNLPLAG